MPFVLFPHGADHFLQFRILHLTFVGAHFLDGQFFLRELIPQSVELAIGKRLSDRPEAILSPPIEVVFMASMCP